MERHERLAIALDYLQKINPGLTYHDIMKDCGYSSPNHLSAFKNGKKPFGDRFLKPFEKIYLIRQAWIETGDGDMNKDKKDITEEVGSDKAIEIKDKNRAIIILAKKIAELEKTNERPYKKCLGDILAEIL